MKLHDTETLLQQTISASTSRPRQLVEVIAATIRKFGVFGRREL